MTLRKKATLIIEEINKKGFEAVLVGGCVRDKLLNIEPKDFDIATNMPIDEITLTFGEENVTPIGLRSIEIGVVGVKIDGDLFEVAQFRSEQYEDENTRFPTTKFVSSVDKDLARRDFTINAMAFNPLTETLVDVFGGTKDMKDKIIKCVGIAEDRFNEDPLRLLRAVRFSARFGFEIEDETLNAMKKLSHKISIISQERIRMELEKIVMTDNVEKAFRVLHETGILAIILPELERTFGFDQNSKWHAFTLEGHILKAVDRSAKILEVRLALLFHDIAKQDCVTTDEHGSHFFGHDRKSSKMAKDIMKRLKFTTKQIELVSSLIFLHMSRFNDFGNKGIRKMVDLIGEENIHLLREVWIGDEKGHFEIDKEGMSNAIEKFEKIENFVNNPNTNIKISNLKVNGRDLIELGIKGIEIGTTLNRLLNEVLSCQTENTKEELIKSARGGINE